MIIPEKKQLIEINGDGVDLDELPINEIPYRAEDGSIRGSGLRIQSNGTLLAPVGFGVESGSVDFGDAIRVSESATLLGLQNMVDKKQYYFLDYAVPRDGQSQRPYRLMLSSAERKVEAQSNGSSVITKNPLTFDYTTKLTARTNALVYNASEKMTNVRIRITDKASGVALKYFPSKAAWITGKNGTTFDVGENVLDFEDTAVIFTANTLVSFDIVADNISLRGNSAGIPWFAGILQEGSFIGIADVNDISALQAQVSQNTFDKKYSSLTDVPTEFKPAPHSHTISDIEGLQSNLSDIQSEITSNAQTVQNLAPVAKTNSYNDLTDKPSIPTNNSQLTNGAGYITLSEVPAVNISWADIKNKPTSFTPSSHTHVISDITGLQNSLDSKMDVGAPISYNSLTNKPVLFDGNYNSLSSKPTFANIAFTADYADLRNKPEIPVVSYPVRSVAGRQGDVILSVNDLNGISTVGKTNDYADLSNKPIIPPAVSLTTSGNSGAASYNAATGALNIPSYQAPVNADWNSTTGLSRILNKPTTLAGYGITDAVNSSVLTGYATTAQLATKYDIPTGTTSQYVRGDGTLATFPTIPSVNYPVTSVNSKTGAVVLTTSDIAEGIRLYYTDARVASYLAAAGQRRVETFLGTSDAQGNYTVTFAQPFTTPPDVQPQIVGGTFNQFVRVVSVSTTGCTVQVAQRNTAQLLGLEILLGATVALSGASISIQVTSRS